MPPFGGKGRKAKPLINDTGKPIDRKTKQLVFYECDVETVKRAVLKNGENFSREGANQVFARGYRKRQARAILFCLTDRMRFQKRSTLGSQPFRKQLTYREIKHFFVFPSNPDVFMLSVVDEISGKRIYEMYRCRPEDVSTICDLTFKASTDPQNLLRNLPPSPQLSISSRDCATEPSAVSNGESHENSSEDLKTQDPVYSVSDYLSNHHRNEGHRAVQNCHEVQCSPIFERNYLYDNQYRPNTPPRALTSNATYPTNVKPNIKAVYSCYEMVGAEKPNTNIVKFSQFQTASPDYTIQSDYAPMVNGKASKTTVQPEKLTPPISNLHEPITPQRYPQDVYTRLNRYSPPPVRANTIQRIVIERDPDANPPIRKSISTQNLNWGDEVTYISYNPVKGTSISEMGPMYMYITRHESTNNLSALTPNFRFNSPTYGSEIPHDEEYLD